MMFDLMSVNWQQVAAFLTVAVMVGGVVAIVLERRLSSRFVDEKEHLAAVARIDLVERAQRIGPDQKQFEGLSGRVGKLEDQVQMVKTGVQEVQVAAGQLATGQQGILREINGVSHQMELVLKTLLQREGA